MSIFIQLGDSFLILVDHLGIEPRPSPYEGPARPSGQWSRYTPFGVCCEFFGFAHLPFTKKLCQDLRPGTGGRLCSPNLRIWNPRSPLSYTRILFERVRICTSQRGSIGRVYLTTRPPGLPPSVSPYQSASTLFRHRSMVQRPVPLPSI